MVEVLKVFVVGIIPGYRMVMTLSSRTIKCAPRDVLIKASFDDSKKHNGTRCIQQDLADNNSKADIKTIIAKISRQRLVSKAVKTFKVTTYSNHKNPDY